MKKPGAKPGLFDCRLEAGATFNPAPDRLQKVVVSLQLSVVSKGNRNLLAEATPADVIFCLI